MAGDARPSARRRDGAPQEAFGVAARLLRSEPECTAAMIGAELVVRESTGQAPRQRRTA